MRLKLLKQIKNLKNKRVLLRVDFNVPIKNKKVVDDFKIQKSLSTIQYLIKKGAKVILVSHLGRPKRYDKKLSLLPVAKTVSRLLKRKIKMVDVKNWNKIVSETKKISSGSVALLENIRFIKGEEQNDKTVAEKLASLADIFVLDGFAVAHRNATSVSGVARYLPAYAGLLLSDEIEGLSKILEKHKRPLVIVLGGVKMETKIPLLKKFLIKADYVLLGGGIVGTYLWAKGRKVGCSLVERKLKREVLFYGAKKKVIIPVDVVVGKNNGYHAQVVKVDKNFAVPGRDYGIYDIGPGTIKLYTKYIKQAQTLVWNGAMGYFEQPPYQYGTYSIARLMAARSRGRAFGVCGGGETLKVVKKLGLMDDIDLVSTGGGAMLEFLSGQKLPGIEAIKIKN